MEHWIAKFRNAAKGLPAGMLGQSSFAVHLAVSLAVVVLAILLECQIWQWCVLLLCMALVLSLELMNSAVESLAKGLCKEHNEHVGRSLDIASGAVLIASIFAAIVGLIVFAQQYSVQFW
mgnify:CR=1 FL=1